MERGGTMHRRRAGTFLVAFLIVLLLPLLALGQGRDVVRILAPILPAQVPQLKLAIERELPHIEAQIEGWMTVEVITFQDVAERIRQGMYDVVILTVGTEFLARDGLLMPLESFLARTGFTHPLFPSMRLDGQLYDLPLFVDPFVVLYNQELFDRYGVPYPSTEWTWDEFLNVAERIGGMVRAEPLYGATLPFRNMVDFMLDQLMVNRGAVTEEEVYYALSALGRIVQESSVYIDGLGLTPEFRRGDVAMEMTSLSQTLLLEATARGAGSNFVWGIAPLPTMPGQPGIWFQLVSHPTVSVAANARNPIAAWETAQVIATKGQSTFPIANFALSAYASDAEVEAWIERMLPGGGKGKGAVAREILLGRPGVFQYRDLTSLPFDEALAEQVDLLLQARVTPEEALAELQRLGHKH